MLLLTDILQSEINRRARVQQPDTLREQIEGLRKPERQGSAFSALADVGWNRAIDKVLGIINSLSTAEKTDNAALPEPPNPQAVVGAKEPCHISEYDGAYKCCPHDKIWGAVAKPDKPCVPTADTEP